VGSRFESLWWDRGGYALPQLLDHGQHFVVVRPKVQMVGKEVVPEIVPVTAYTLPQTTPPANQRDKENPFTNMMWLYQAFPRDVKW